MKNIIQQSKLLAKNYDIVATNPPYMGNSGMNPNLKDYIKSNFPLTKTDLFAVFLEKGLEMIKDYGFNCMVTMQSWMFLSSFEKFRKKLIETTTISNLLHMDNMVMRIAFGTSATVFRKINLMNYNSTFYHVKLSDVEKDIVDPLFFNNKPDNIKELYENLKERILNEFEDIEIVATKLYIVFKTSNKIIISIEAFKGQLKGWINLKNTKLIDPFNKTRDVSNIGHHGIGDYEMKIANDEDIDYFISLFKQAYKEKL